MSAFYGSVIGNHTEATRGGSKSSGFRSSCQSYDGSIITRMWYDKDNKLVVSLECSEGSSSVGKTIFTGSIDELKETLLRK